MSIQDMYKLMQQAKQMKKNILKKQEELKEKKIKISNKNNSIEVVFSGDLKINSLKLNSEIIDFKNIELLEKLIIDIINEGLIKTKKIASDEIGSLTGGINLPGL